MTLSQKLRKFIWQGDIYLTVRDIHLRWRVIYLTVRDIFWQEGTIIMRGVTILLQIIRAPKFWSCVRTLNKHLWSAAAASIGLQVGGRNDVSIEPDRTSQNYRVSRAGNLRISCSSETSCDGFWSSGFGREIKLSWINGILDMHTSTEAYKKEQL